MCLFVRFSAISNEAVSNIPWCSWRAVACGGLSEFLVHDGYDMQSQEGEEISVRALQAILSILSSTWLSVRRFTPKSRMLGSVLEIWTFDLLWTIFCLPLIAFV